MPTRAKGPGECQHPGCRKTHKTHKWGNIKAHSEGWYMMKDGREWCPDHRPEWAPDFTPESFPRKS